MATEIFDNTKAGWKNLVGFLIIIKREIAEFESPSLIGETLPELGATSDELREFARICETAPAEFNEWIGRYNGWHNIYFNFSLFSLPEVIRASEAMAFDEILEVILDEEPQLDPKLLFVVGRDPLDGQYLLVSANPSDPRAYWVGEGDANEFPSFIYAFNWIVMLHQSALEGFKSGRSKPAHS
ncbi:hypothetical protein EH165_12445 [Nakamurella antarctica]|uniref:SMI1/KNR4 family protein n=1 Tax=Nakamurella antarctica TaxID=1902245 RepID=A0A3G8ZXU6_9ACTN|nr:SMI1/KNR4 family protein [Nakamurella antarctica]AZI58826.1 hypothetical protein EH165_12445 [Nakamurella antarctica]